LAARLPAVRVIQLPVGRPHRAAYSALLPELASRGIASVGREVFAGVDPSSDQRAFKSRLREVYGFPDMSVVLVGVSSREHLETNLAAIE
jgi:hypothetical protein